MVGWIFLTELDWGIWKEFLPRSFWNGPWLGELEIFLVGKCESEALDEMDGDVAGQYERGYQSVKRMGLGLVNAQNGCWVVSVDGRLLRGAETAVVHSYALRRPY